MIKILKSTVDCFIYFLLLIVVLYCYFQNKKISPKIGSVCLKLRNLRQVLPHWFLPKPHSITWWRSEGRLTTRLKCEKHRKIVKSATTPDKGVVYSLGTRQNLPRHYRWEERRASEWRSFSFNVWPPEKLVVGSLPLF